MLNVVRSAEGIRGGGASGCGGRREKYGTDKPAARWEDAAYLISIYASKGSRDVI